MGDATNKAVFLSYASQDAEAARRICDALRAAGVEVWFDQSELRGGDAWDAKIRKQIKECALFVPVISAITQARLEGYFRIEWKLAAQRTHAMAEEKAFLLPIVIDETPDGDAKVPAEFKNVQWTRLPGGETPEKFCARVEALLSGEVAANRFEVGASLVGAREVRNADGRGRATPLRKPSRPWLAPAIAGVAAVVALALWQPWKPPAPAVPFAKETKVVAAPTSPVDVLVAKARALLDDDPLMTRGNVELAEQLSLEAIAKEPTHAEAYAVAAWANFRFIGENYDVTPQRRADLRKYAQKARLLAPDSVNAELAMCGLLRLTGGRAEAIKRLQALEARVPKNFTVLRELAWASAFGSGRAEDDEPEVVARLWAFSPLGRAYAESMRASRHWARAEYVEADRLLDGIFASGHPVRMSYMNRLLVLTYGWGDLATAQAFVATIPSKLLLEDAFINHVTNVWLYSGDYEKALATLDRTQREMLREARVAIPTAMLRGNVLAAAGRLNAAAIQWREALKLVDKQLTADPASARFHADKAILLAALGERETAAREFALVAELTHPAAGSIEWGSSFEYYAAMGDIESAIPRLDRLIARDYGRWPNVYNQLRNWPALAKLRQDPRGQAMLARGAQWLAEMKAAGAKPSPAAATISAAPAAGVNDKSAAADKSVAVLAFANLSDDKANEYFSDGISEELLNVLAKVPGLRVVGRASSFQFKGTKASAAEIGQKLNAAHLVGGSVQRLGSRARINAQLTVAATGDTVWSQKFDVELKDIFATQDDIAGQIAENLKLKLGTTRPTKAINPAAHRLLLEGRYFWNLRSIEGFAQAESAIAKALAIDPNFAEAHAALADVYNIRMTYALQDGRLERVSPQEIARARAEAQRAVELDPTLADAYPALAYSAFLEMRFAEAEQQFQKALAMNPNNAAAHAWHSTLLLSQGRLEEGLRRYEQADALDPLWAVNMTTQGEVLNYARRYEAALGISDRALALRPDYVPNLGNRARTLWELGRKSEAVEVAREVRRLLEKSPRRDADASAIWVLKQAGFVEEAAAYGETVLRTLPATSQQRGFVLGALGQFEEALPYLGRTPPVIRRRLYWDPMWDRWREDPRFTQLMKQLGCLEEYNFARRALATISAQQPAPRK